MSKLSNFFRKHYKVENSHLPAVAVLTVLIGAILVGGTLAGSYTPPTASAEIPASVAGSKTLGASIQAQTPKMIYTPSSGAADQSETSTPATANTPKVQGQTTKPAPTPKPHPLPIPIPTPLPEPQPQPLPVCKKLGGKYICCPIYSPTDDDQTGARYCKPTKPLVPRSIY